MNSTTLEKVKYFSGADLRARRLALGLYSNDAAASLLGDSVWRIKEWESNFHLSSVGRAMARIDKLEDAADDLVDDLAARSRVSGEIVTYRSDAAAEAAGELIRIAAMHRVCAARAALDSPDATVRVLELTDSEHSSAARKSELMLRLSMLGLSTHGLAAIGLERRPLQQFLAGKRDVFPDVWDRLADLEAAADAHQDRLEDRLDRLGAQVPLQVASTAEDLAELDPEAPANLPIETHQFIVGALLAGDREARAEWITVPPSAVEEITQRKKAGS